MTYDDLIEHYGTQAGAAAALGIDRQRVFGWSKTGKVPLDLQLNYELDSGGKLQADLSPELREMIAKSAREAARASAVAARPVTASTPSQ